MEYALILLALVLGLVPTIWDKPSDSVKWAIRGALVLVAGFSIQKAVSDDRDKHILQDLAITGLTLPSSAHDFLYAQVNVPLAGAG